MRLRVVSLFVSCFALAMEWACALNPQPLPPDGYDASTDTSLAANPDATGGADASTADVSPPPQGDDAATDASDSGDSSASDAADDARDDGGDGATDAGEDG